MLELFKSIATTKKKGPHFWLTRVGLLLIIFLGFFLRFEDFATWQKHKSSFQFMEEYQMANFDSYYYLKTAKDLDAGNYGEKSTLRRVPNGLENPSIPPLSSVIVVTAHKITGVPIATIAIFIPVIFGALLALLIFALARSLKYNNISALTAALFSILSLAFIIRTRIGVFDTDSLNVLFPTLLAYLYYLFSKTKEKKRYIYLGLGLLSSFLFYSWWHTASSIVVASSLIPLLVAFVFFYNTEKKTLKYLALGIISLISLYLVKDQILTYVDLFLHQTKSDFPNNMSVSELNSISLKEFIKNTAGNTFIFFLMLVGLVALVFKIKIKALFFVIPIALAFSSVLLGNRFMIFAAPVLALGIGYIVQLLFNQKKWGKPIIGYGFALLLVIIGITSNYKNITKGYKKTAARNNMSLLTALEKNTPKNATIWTAWDLGYQIQYYLDRGTYADGEFTDGEYYYYVAFPLASDNLAVSSNFIRFYNKHGKAGMDKLYAGFPSVAKTFDFLKKVLALSPKEATLWLEDQTNIDMFGTTSEFISFLFPKESEDVYLFIYYNMTQTAAWFKQGNADLTTKKTKGMPLFLALSKLKREGQMIKSREFLLNTQNGVGNYMGNSKQAFKSILSFDGESATIQSYPNTTTAKDNRFVFQWNEKTGFGAAMSQEMANTTFVKLFMQEMKSPYFEPILLNNPKFQIWRITGNAYEIE